MEPFSLTKNANKRSQIGGCLMKKLSIIDQFCLSFDQTLRTLTGNVSAIRPYPAANIAEAELSDDERRHAGALMRVNHAGEVCAQALYNGQAFFSKNHSVQAKMREAAMEEGDHLDWCCKRIHELQTHESYLNPLWYSGSFAIGALAAMIGDDWSLGFVAETETQVVKHLQNHLRLLPEKDQRSHAILQQMQVDEEKHKDTAVAEGAKALPQIIKKVMAFTSKMMVKTSYHI